MRCAEAISRRMKFLDARLGAHKNLLKIRRFFK